MYQITKIENGIKTPLPFWYKEVEDEYITFFYIFDKDDDDMENLVLGCKKTIYFEDGVGYYDDDYEIIDGDDKYEYLIDYI